MRLSKKLTTHNLKLITTVAVVLFIVGYLFLAVNPVRAEIEIDVISSPDTAVTDESIAAYIVRLYWFAVGAAGIVAVAVIVGGGIYYMTSSGNPGKQNEAKSYITSALWGVILLLGSFFILNTINPEIIKLESLDKAFSLPPCDSGGQPGIDCMPATPEALPLCEGDKVRTGKRLDDGTFETVPAEPGTNCLPACGVSERTCGIGESVGQTKYGEKPCVKCVYSPNIPPEGVGCSSACFFDPNKEGSEATLDEDALWSVGTVIDKRTEACDPNNPKRTAPCVCENCQPIPETITIKSTNTCLNATLKVCFLKKSTLDKIKPLFLYQDIKDNFAINKWRITEAFPPVVNHLSEEHYNGRAFDIAPASTSECGKAIDIGKRFADAGFRVLVEGPAGSCPEISDEHNATLATGVTGINIKRLVNNAAFHLHIVK